MSSEMGVVIMKFFNEFKEFIARGNVVDMAVGVVVGAAFKGIVDSLVASIVTPLLGLLTGKVDIANLAIVVSDDLTIAYGAFLQSIINFLIIAFSVFCMVKFINGIKKRFEKPAEVEVVEEEEPSKEEVLLTEIRDLLAKK